MLRFRTLIVVAAAGAALAIVGSAGAVAPKLNGTVGPGFTISLKRGTAPVRLLKAGSYSITVVDKSNIHNFRLMGPGLNKEITSVGFVGTKTIVAALKRGTYKFVCDPHATIMKGSFTVA